MVGRAKQTWEGRHITQKGAATTTAEERCDACDDVKSINPAPINALTEF